MTTYYTPTCGTGMKLVKSRCKCKTEKKRKVKKTKKATKKAPKKGNSEDKYEEHWALKAGQYSTRTPSKKQLIVRRKRIDELYKVYEKIKKLDGNYLHPSKWAYPPEFCYNLQLQEVLKGITKEFKYLKAHIV